MGQFEDLKGKSFGFCGNGDGNAQDKENNNRSKLENKEEKEESLLELESVTEQDISFIFSTITKEAEHDKIPIKQLVYGFLSTFTKIPIPHNVNSKNSGSGKSYLLNKVASYFPQKYIEILAGASSKSFFHKIGMMVIKDQETGELKEIEPIVESLEDQIEAFEDKISEYKDAADKKKYKEKIKDIKSDINFITGHQQKLIDLNNTIIIIQDTPPDALFDALMSLMSQDSEDTNRDQEYQFTDKLGSGKLETRSNILRGMPVLFTTCVTDNTKNPRFEEVARRFINITPNTSKEKIEAANKLIFRKAGMVPDQYDQLVLSKTDKQAVKDKIESLVSKLIKHSKDLKPKQTGIFIPFQETLGSAMPTEDNEVMTMTVSDRLSRYLAIITKVHMDCRPRLVHKETGVFYPIATFEDLKETLTLMEMAATNIRGYVVDWYNRVFVPAFKTLFKALGGEPRIKTSEYDPNMIIAKESYVGLTTNELAEKTKEVMSYTPGIREIREKFLDPLSKHGLVNYARSQINRSENIYFLADPNRDKIFSLFSDVNDLRLEVKDPAVFPSRKFIEESLISIVKQDAQVDSVLEKKYELQDHEGNEWTIEKMIEKYFHNSEVCFKKGYNDADIDATLFSTNTEN